MSIKIKVTDEMIEAWWKSYRDPAGGLVDSALRAVLDIVERDLNATAKGIWLVGERSGRFIVDAPAGCIEVED